MLIPEEQKNCGMYFWNTSSMLLSSA